MCAETQRGLLVAQSEVLYTVAVIPTILSLSVYSQCLLCLMCNV